MGEPEFLAQSGEPMSSEERLIWLEAQAAAGRAAGATFFRASIHPGISDLILMEGWIVRPDEQGEPRWQMEAKT